MSKEERYAEHTVAWELPNGDSVTKSNYNLADIETKYIPIQTEVICDDKDKTIADLEAKLAESNAYKLRIELAGADETIAHLKQQLAEKEKLLRKYAATSCPIHQGKISFAVEQLEKVKNEIYGSEVKFEEIEKLPIALNNYEIGYDKGRFKATNIIDNQIKQLKEQQK